jgi:hypothetical protein
VRSPLERGGAMLVSRNGHSALVQFNVRGDMMQTMDRVAPVLRAVASVQKSHEGFRVEEFGTASFGKAADFYDFYRAMQSYQTTFIGDGQEKAAPTTIILSPQNDYLKEFTGRSK